MTSKERAYLRSKANTMDSIFAVGKSGITPEITAAIQEALDSRELIKISVLKNCLDDPGNIGLTLSERTHSQLIQIVGRKITLFKESKDNPKFFKK